MATKKKFLGNNGLDANNQTISNVATPSASSDASTKGYADTLVPSQAGNTGKYLTTNGSETSWATVTASASAEALTGTTIASTVTGSSLTSVGTLGSLTVSGNATFDTNTLFVDATNDRVGVGTVSPTDKLHIVGNIFVTNKIFNGSSNDSAGITFPSASTRIDGYNGITFHSSATTVSSQTERMRITQAGNLGLGTSSPSEKLSIKSATGINSVTDIASFSNPSQTSAGVRVLFNNGYGNLGAISSFQLDNGAGADNGVLAFQTASDTVLSTKMTILDTGAVGMGTVSPSAKLDVVGTSFFLRPSSVNAVGHFDIRNDTASPVSVRLAFGTDNTGWQMRFSKNYQGTYTDYMTINDVGNIGIGTVSPAYKLDVNGTGYFSGGTNSIIAQDDGGAGAWRGRILSKNATYDRASFLGNYNGVAGVFAHNNALNAWADLYVNTVDGSGGGTVRMPSSVFINGNQAIHAGNYSSYALPLSGGTISGDLTVTGRVSLTNSVAQIYQEGSRLKVRSESVDSVAQFANYGMFLPLTNQTYNLYLAEGMQIGYSTANPYLSYRNGALIFRADATERARLTSGGDFGLGTSSPAYKLDINGNARITGRFYSNEWIQFDSYSGLYAPLNSGAYIYPNPSAYGSWKVEGQRNGWCGLEFQTTSNGNVSLMIQPNANTVGFHNNEVGWQFRWNVGTLYCHKGTLGGGTEATVLDSSNYNTYAPTKTGTGASGTWNIDINGNAGGSSGSVKVVGYGTGTLTYNQTSGTFAGFTDGWASYIICNHGDGATYYNQTLIMPFWSAPRYTRLEGGTLKGPYIFLSTENYTTYAVPTGDVSVSNVADKIVKRDGNGDINFRYGFSSYLNQSGGNSENPTIGQIWTQNTTDNYCRKSTPAHFKNQMGMYVNGGSSTSNNITISSSSATGGSNGDIWLKY